MEYKIHDVEWTDEKVSRFWDFQNKYEPFETIWFTRQVGKGIVNFIRGHVKLTGNILDYGTGKGHLIQHLLPLTGATVYGFDFSPESIANVDKKYKASGNYKGTTLMSKGENFTTYPSDFFDVVFLVEAIEHLTDKYFESTVTEISRLLKKGGIVIVTTPNKENLPLQHVLCPDCGAVYHRVQHMRGFDEENLEELMSKQSFQTVGCSATNFAYYNDQWSPSSVLKRAVASLRSGYVPPHLWYIGRK